MSSFVPLSQQNFRHPVLPNPHTFLGKISIPVSLQNEAYQLFWPDQPEFVRMAIKFGATIVPIAGVGSADSINLVRAGPRS